VAAARVATSAMSSVREIAIRALPRVRRGQKAWEAPKAAKVQRDRKAQRAATNASQHILTLTKDAIATVNAAMVTSTFRTTPAAAALRA
jgi:hypothetical protein